MFGNNTTTHMGGPAEDLVPVIRGRHVGRYLGPESVEADLRKRFRCFAADPDGSLAVEAIEIHHTRRLNTELLVDVVD